jgi:hypothetical protein
MFLFIVRISKVYLFFSSGSLLGIYVEVPN